MSAQSKSGFIRLARAEEMVWINSKYAEVKFIPSDFNNEFIAIGEVNQERAALGRLVRINEENCELGGMYVFPGHRGKGIAGEIVKFLLEISGTSKNIYCIPFARLEHFYRSFGLAPVKDMNRVPEVILNKHRWCNRFYHERLGLLMLEKSLNNKFPRTVHAKEKFWG